MEDILIEFQLYLNDRKLINNHDWDFEKEAKKFIKQRVQTNDWLSVVKTAYVVGLVGFPVEVNIDSLDYEKKIVNISTKEGEKATRKFNEVYQFYSDCDFR